MSTSFPSVVLSSPRGFMKSPKLSLKLSMLLALFTMPIAVITLSSHPATASCTGSGPCNDVRLHGVCDTAECVTVEEAYQSGSNAVFRFAGGPGTDYYLVRYKTRNGEKQVENRSGRFTVKNIQPGYTYSISIKGCVKHFLSRSTCSRWVTASVAAR
jgi:hypothetical protein